MTNAKSTRIIAVGVAVFVIGGALMFLVLNRSSSSGTPRASTNLSAPATTTTIPGAVVIPASPPTTTVQFKIPAGLNAVAVPMDYFAGDMVNIYAILNKDCSTATAPGAVKLIFSNVKVLEIFGNQPASTGSSAAFLLAMSPQDAERTIFSSKFEGLYLTLTTGNEPPVATSGVTCSATH
jgi:hypothetical protein